MKATIFTFCIVCLTFMMGCSVNSSNKEKFIKLFDHEIQNRAYALEYTAKSAASWDDEKIKDFWAVYYELEIINQKLYKPYANKYKLEMGPRFFTHIKIGGSNVLSSLFPDYMLGAIYKATKDYVSALQEMEKLAPDEDKAFFRYVVVQEEVQLEALKLVSEGGAEEATKLLQEYKDQIASQ